jgi:hypothetical protein
VLAHTIVVLGGACKSCETTPTAFVVWSPPCMEGNKVHDISVGSLIVKTAGSGLGEACWKAHRRLTCTWGRPKVIHRVTQLGASSLQGLPCEGLQRGLGEILHASRYLGKNTRVIDGSLHLYLIFSFHLYCNLGRVLYLF